MTNPEGVKLSDSSSLKIGKQIGEGSCSTIHLVDGAPEYAAKVVPLPGERAGKDDSSVEKNAKLLKFEASIYQKDLESLQGTVIPDISKDAPYGDREGFRYLVMERMGQQLADVPEMMKKEKGDILFGVLAVRLLKCIQAIHEKKFIVIDVKSDNFMLAEKERCNLEGDFVTDIAMRVRMLDLALIMPYEKHSSYRENNGKYSGNGTPLFRSIAMHKGSTPSRRDDLESLVYVLAELLILYHRTEDQSSKYVLPWSKLRSDEEIGKAKAQQLSDIDSEFYQSIGGGEIARNIAKFLDTVRKYDYDEEPDYEYLCEILMSLKLPAKQSSATEPQQDTSPATVTLKRAGMDPITVPIPDPIPVTTPTPPEQPAPIVNPVPVVRTAPPNPNAAVPAPVTAPTIVLPAKRSAEQAPGSNKRPTL